MALQQDDVGWYLPDRLDDTDDGGGEMTLEPLVEGPSTNLFDDVDDIARIYGEVSIRLAYAAVSTANTEALFGPHFILTEAPADPNASLLIGYPGAWGARRQAIADRISRFLTQGPRYPGFLWDLQVEGSRSVTLFQRPENPVPQAGDALLLIENEGQPGAVEQYVRVLKVTAVVRNFQDSTGEFKRLIVTLELASPLERDFHGAEISRYDTLQPSAIVRTTIVSDAVRFFGLKPLADSASLGAMTVAVDNPYARLIPSTQSETAVNDLAGAAFQTQLIQAGDVRRLATGVAGARVLLDRALTPGTVAISGSATLTDTGAGTATGNGLTATLDYQAGIIQLPYSGSWNVDAAPAAAVTGASYTYAIPVTQGNRGFVWTCLLPAGGTPARGVLAVDYRAMGKWYRLQDDGSYRLVSDGAGTGSIVSSTVTATFTALPDIGSQVIFTWSSPALYARNDSAQIALPQYRIAIVGGLAAESLTLTWLSGGQEKTATDNGAGAITGDATGSIAYLTGTGLLTPTALPDPGTQIHCVYQSRTSFSGSLTPSLNGQVISGQIDGSMLPLRPGTVYLEVPYQWTYQAGAGGARTRTLVVTDDGSGHFVSPYIQSSSLDYQTGAFSITLNTMVSV